MNLNNMVPVPIIDANEEKSLIDLQQRYDKLIEPNVFLKVGAKVANHLPNQIKDFGSSAKKVISEADFIKQALEYAASGFKILNETAAKVTVSERAVIKTINKTLPNGEISSLEEICFARAYNISKAVNKYRTTNTLIATIEGAGTGALGFIGLVPNIVASTFLYFRAVQSVAMYYGYDVKNNAQEMEIASSVLMSALNPMQDASNNELTAAIGKFMIFTETTAVKQTSKKTWTAMAEHGGLALIITQIRALANVSAKKALENAGKKGLEQTVFKSILEQLGKKVALESAGKSMIAVGAVFGAFFDTAQMRKILDYADIFYSKRFIEEKEARINSIIGNDDVSDCQVVDADFETVEK